MASTPQIIAPAASTPAATHQTEPPRLVPEKQATTASVVRLVPMSLSPSAEKYKVLFPPWIER